MATWDEVAKEAPDLAERAQERFDAHLHKVLATLRADGSPRVSGIEARFLLGELWLGMMPGSLKARDLQRDGRMALHGATVDTDLAEGDVKLAGRAVEVTDDATIGAVVRAMGDATGAEPPQPFHLFRVDVGEVVLTRVAGDHLLVDTWHEGRGLGQHRIH